MNFKDLMQNLEADLSSLDASKRYAIYFSTILLVGGLNYYYFMEGIIKQTEKEKQKLEKLKQEVKSKSPQVIMKKIKDEKSKQLKLSEEIESLEYKKIALRTKFDSMKFLFLTDDKFAQFLNNVLKDSVNKGIMLSDVIIEEIKEDKHYIGKLYLAKRLKMQGSGDYLNIENFLRNIEKQNILQKFDIIKIETDGDLTKFMAEMTLLGDKR